MLELNFAKSHSYFLNKRIEFIKELSEIEGKLSIISNKINRLLQKEGKCSEKTELINSLKEESKELKSNAEEIRTLINIYYVAQESIRSIILIKNYKDENFDRFMDGYCDNFAPVIRKKIYEAK